MFVYLRTTNPHRRAIGPEPGEVLDGASLFSNIRRAVMVNADPALEYGDIRLTGHDGGDFLFVPR
jgi:hypothetical protein